MMAVILKETPSESYQREGVFRDVAGAAAELRSAERSCE